MLQHACTVRCMHTMLVVKEIHVSYCRSIARRRCNFSPHDSVFFVYGATCNGTSRHPSVKSTAPPNIAVLFRTISKQLCMWWWSSKKKKSFLLFSCCYTSFGHRKWIPIVGSGLHASSVNAWSRRMSGQQVLPKIDGDRTGPDVSLSTYSTVDESFSLHGYNIACGVPDGNICSQNIIYPYHLNTRRRSHIDPLWKFGRFGLAGGNMHETMGIHDPKLVKLEAARSCMHALCLQRGTTEIFPNAYVRN